MKVGSRNERTAVGRRLLTQIQTLEREVRMTQCKLVSGPSQAEVLSLFPMFV